MDIFELRYMRRIRFILRGVGAWPSHVFEDPRVVKRSAFSKYGYTSFLAILCVYTIYAQVMYVKKNMGIKRFIDLGQTLLTILLSSVYLQRTLLPLESGYQEVIKEFAGKFNVTYDKDKTEFSAQTANKVNKFCEMATIVQIVQLVTSSFMFNAAPFFQNYYIGMFGANKPENATYVHSVSYHLPWDHNNVFGYIIVVIFNYYVSINLAVIFCGQDLLICVIVFHVWGHLTIFEHNLNFFTRPKSVKGRESYRYSLEENKEVTENLKEIVLLHLKIKKFLASTSGAYSLTLCVYYGFHLVADCVMLLECSSMEPDAIATYSLLTLLMYQQLIQLSVVFELVSTKGDVIIDAVYGLPWECMDSSNRKTVLILLQAVQQSLALKACNMVPVGVQTMQAIIKASFSYFMMLRAFAQ